MRCIRHIALPRLGGGRSCAPSGSVDPWSTRRAGSRGVSAGVARSPSCAHRLCAPRAWLASFCRSPRLSGSDPLTQCFVEEMNAKRGVVWSTGSDGDGELCRGDETRGGAHPVARSAADVSFRPQPPSRRLHHTGSVTQARLSTTPHIPAQHPGPGLHVAWRVRHPQRGLRKQCGEGFSGGEWVARVSDPGQNAGRYVDPGHGGGTWQVAERRAAEQ